MTRLTSARLYNAEQSRRLDAAIIASGVSGFTLMQRAAQACFSFIQNKYPRQHQMTVITGAGNNAGDGYLVACLAQLAGWQVKVYFLIDPSHLVADAASAYLQAKEQKIAILPFSANSQFSGLIVDAILGTGCNKDLAGNFLTAVEKINNHSAAVCSVDIPSGLSADTGNIFKLAVKADLTVSFIGLKLGLFSQDALDYVGELQFADLAAPAQIVAQHPFTANLLTKQHIPLLPARAKHCHKGNFGHSFIIGGDYGMAGAVILAATAALRCGSGLVTVATRQKHTEQLNIVQPELMTYALDTNIDSLDFTKATVLAIGPGFGTAAFSNSLLTKFIGEENNLIKPQVWDADALNWLAQQSTELVDSIKTKSNWLLTPHPAEAARLLHTSVAEIQAARIAAAQELAKRYNATIILKGSSTLITAPESECYLCHGGSPNLAGAGMGDVLTGWLVGLLAQGMSNLAAARLASYLHCQAAKQILPQGRGLLASELITAMRQQLQQLCPL